MTNNKKLLIFLSMFFCFLSLYKTASATAVKDYLWVGQNGGNLYYCDTSGNCNKHNASLESTNTSLFVSKLFFVNDDVYFEREVSSGQYELIKVSSLDGYEVLNDGIPRLYSSIAYFNNTVWAGDRDGHLWECDSNWNCVDHGDKGGEIGDLVAYDGQLWLTQISPGSDGYMYEKYQICDTEGDCTDQGALMGDKMIVVKMESFGDYVWVAANLSKSYYCDADQCHLSGIGDIRSMEVFNNELWLSTFSGFYTVNSFASSTKAVDFSTSNIFELAVFDNKLWGISSIDKTIRVYNSNGDLENSISKFWLYPSTNPGLLAAYNSNNIVKPFDWNEEPVCADSDGGLNYFENGLTGREGFSPYADSCYCPISGDDANLGACSSGPYLGEWYCDDTDYPKMQNRYECPYGCENGACKEAPSCTESENKICDDNESNVEDNRDFMSTEISHDSNYLFLTLSFYDDPINFIGTPFYIYFSSDSTIGAADTLIKGYSNKFTIHWAETPNSGWYNILKYTGAPEINNNEYKISIPREYLLDGTYDTLKQWTYWMATTDRIPNSGDYMYYEISNPSVCADSDEGQDYYSSGYVIDTLGSRHNDTCLNSETVTEFWCEADSSYKTTQHECPYGCENGACKEAPIDDDVNSITLSGSGANISWTVNGYSRYGFKVVWSKNSGPTYPVRSGDQYHYYSSPDKRSDTLTDFNGYGTYYVRVCEYVGGVCDLYSNEISVVLGTNSSGGGGSSSGSDDDDTDDLDDADVEDEDSGGEDDDGGAQDDTEDDSDVDDSAKKVVICQVPPGNPEGAKTITVSKSALDAHLKNGSYLGPCVNNNSSSEEIQGIKKKATELKNNQFDVILVEIKELRDQVREQETQIKYLKKLTEDTREIAQETQEAINNFITYGVDDNTKKLGAGERAAVMYSYKNAFKKLPETEDELEDAIKIANGRWPSLASEEAEKQAKEQFQKIYKRVPDMSDPKDNAAITVMAYGLRQRAENRNLESEKKGIQTFMAIYGYHPQSTEDWNIMQAITYSGATRGIDTDKDLLTDEKELELGTDPNNPDSDGDTYVDGIEVLYGYDPLG